MDGARPKTENDQRVCRCRIREVSLITVTNTSIVVVVYVSSLRDDIGVVNNFLTLYRCGQQFIGDEVRRTRVGGDGRVDGPGIEV